ncbi:MAG: apolipoprotein N-acyltransferase [Williamsia sp.]|nr:apolipoprotein N-acyltransferase [Williamsia sp.]
MKKTSPFVFSLLSGLLLWAAWPVSSLTFLVFVGFVPFLLIEQRITRAITYFYQVYLMLLVWNIGTTWWVCNSTVPGGMAAMLANSLLMSIPWLGYYYVRKTGRQWLAYSALVFFWLSFEYIHLNWQLSWPWLTLGNSFAMRPGWIQWYEYTGTSGGSLWIMVVNILITRVLQTYTRRRLIDKRVGIAAAAMLACPFLLSFLIGSSQHAPAAGKDNVVVVQPNIDPYEKFEQGTQEKQLHLLIQLSEEHMDADSRVVIWPETAVNLPNGIDETSIRSYASLNPIWQFLAAHPRTKLLTGIESYRLYNESNKTPSSRFLPQLDQYYDAFNAAALLDSTGALQLYHKSKLVPGVETLPGFLKFLDTWFEKFGGTASGYASQTERTVITDPASGWRFAPAICYESIYGEFLTAYIRNGANVISIITNDGWWANTSGHKQHMQYARLRAIETRRWVLRSANTGISCFISPDGKVQDAQPWDTAAAIKLPVSPLNKMTFYVQYGDLISKLAIAAAIIVLIYSIYLRRIKRPSTIQPA